MQLQFFKCSVLAQSCSGFSSVCFPQKEWVRNTILPLPSPPPPHTPDFILLPPSSLTSSSLPPPPPTPYSPLTLSSTHPSLSPKLLVHLDPTSHLPTPKVLRCTTYVPFKQYLQCSGLYTGCWVVGQASTHIAGFASIHTIKAKLTL